MNTQLITELPANTADAILELAGRMKNENHKRLVENAAGANKKQALKNWAENKTSIYTYSLTLDEGRVTFPWGTQKRELDTTHSTYMTADGSKTKYDEVLCVAADDNVYIGVFKTIPRYTHVIFYVNGEA